MAKVQKPSNPACLSYYLAERITNLVQELYLYIGLHVSLYFVLFFIHLQITCSVLSGDQNSTINFINITYSQFGRVNRPETLF
jgi:hypothetical protein